jgi:hypothetical protein
MKLFSTQGAKGIRLPNQSSKHWIRYYTIRQGSCSRAEETGHPLASHTGQIQGT